MYPSPSEAAFLATVRGFLDRYWPPVAARERGRGADLEPRRRAFIAALIEAGWSVPGWPRDFGGQGWSERELHLWHRETARVGAPLLDQVGVEWVGPLLIEAGTPEQRQQLLPPIRAGQERWALGLVEPESGSVEAAAVQAVAVPGGYRIDGLKAWVAGGDRAGRMLTLARVGGPDGALALFAVDLGARGVSVETVPLLDGFDVIARITLDSVQVPVRDRIGAEHAGAALAEGLAARVAQRTEPVAALQSLVGSLRMLARELPGESGGSVIEDEDFARKLADLEVTLEGLAVLEARTLGAGPEPGATVPAVPAASGLVAEPVLPLAQKLGQARAAARIGELFSDALGYYALPYPDPVTIDNEGPIGHHYALAALREMLSRRAQPADGGVVFGLRDRIANRLFGY